MLKKLLSIMILIVGIGIILYPSISNTWNSFTQTQAIMNYIDDTNFSKDVKNEILAKADKYNKDLYSIIDRWNLTIKDNNYDNIFTDIIGYIQIEKINVNLPIYKGTEEAALAQGAGHLIGSSLPVGGKSTHSVIAAHTGSPYGKLFTDLIQLELGDTFVIKVLDRTLTYEVDQIKTVAPTEFSDLNIIKDQDYVTLTTCTPYGINTYRLLVRAHRIKTIENKSSYEEIEDLKIIKILTRSIDAPLPIAFILVSITFGLYVIISKTKQNKKYWQ